MEQAMHNQQTVIELSYVSIQ